MISNFSDAEYGLPIPENAFFEVPVSERHSHLIYQIAMEQTDGALWQREIEA